MCTLRKCRHLKEKPSTRSLDNVTHDDESDTFILIVRHNLQLCIYHPSAQRVALATRFTGGEEQGRTEVGEVLEGNRRPSCGC